jgi:uncharacterized membrane protein (UPF0127 family)
MFRKSQYVVVGVVFLILFVGAYLWGESVRIMGAVTCKTHHDTYEVISYDLEGRVVQLLSANTPEKQAYGLMFVKSKADICGYDGMIFRFAHIQQLKFWNKNTLIPLKLYWLRGKEIVGTSDMTAIDPARGPQTWESPAPADGVIEVVGL